MMAERMYDVGFEFLDDGNVNVEQSNGCEGSTYVTLHPLQVRLLAERMGLLAPSLQVPQPLVTAAHARRVRALHERISEFHDCEYYFHEIIERCGAGSEMWLHIRAIFEMAEEVIADLETGEEPECHEKLEKSESISVTSDGPKKRGRPPKADAKTDAQRQQEHRARKAAEAQSALTLTA